MALRNRESIAGAVAREIDRIEQTGDAVGEGAAYKAAWDRRGSHAFKHCDAFKRDAMMVEGCALAVAAYQLRPVERRWAA